MGAAHACGGVMHYFILIYIRKVITHATVQHSKETEIKKSGGAATHQGLPHKHARGDLCGSGS